MSARTTRRSKRVSGRGKKKQVPPTIQEDTDSEYVSGGVGYQGLSTLNGQSESTLFQELCDTNSHHKVSIRNISRLASSEPQQALQQLVTLVFEACGALVDISCPISQLSAQQSVDKIASLCVQDADSFHLLGKTKASKAFAQKYVSFWQGLVEALDADLVFQPDTLLFPLLTWLRLLSASPRRSFRYTACATVFALVQAFVDMSLRLEESLALAQQRLGNEQAKKRRNVSVESAHEQDVGELEEKLTRLEEYTTEIFQDVYTERYRDICEDVRRLCIDSLGSWMVCFSPFLAVHFLKYLGWSLNDSSPVVRRAALRALDKVFVEWEPTESMQQFAQHFSQRLLQMSEDVDGLVAAGSIELTTTFVQKGLLDPEAKQLDSLPSLLWDGSFFLRKAVAKHLSETVFHGDGEEVGKENLLGLVLLYQQHAPDQSSDHVLEVFVQTLWGYLDCLRDWEAFLSLLESTTESIEDQALSHEQLEILMGVLSHSVQLLTTHIQNSKTSKKKHDQFLDHLSQFHHVFLPKLCSLLTAFQADARILHSLLDLLQCMPLSLVADTARGKTMSQLTALLTKLFLMHSSDKTLAQLAQQLSRCAREEHSQREESLELVRSLFLDVLGRFAQLVEDQLDPEELSVTLHRLLQLSSKLKIPEFVDSDTGFHQLLGKLLRSADTSAEILTTLMRISFVCALWNIKEFDGFDVEEQDREVDEYAQGVSWLVGNLSLALDHQDPLVGDCAFLLTGDSLCVLLGHTVFHRVTPPSLLEQYVHYAENRFLEYRSLSHSDPAGLLKMLAGACKVCSKTFDTRLCSEILLNYGVVHADVDGFLRLFMSRLRKIKDSALLYSQFETLKLAWEQRDRIQTDLQGQASKFALVFGVTQTSFDPLVFSGIDYALSSEDRTGFLVDAVLPFVKRSKPSHAERMLGVFEEKLSQVRVPSSGMQFIDVFRAALETKAKVSSSRKRKEAADTTEGSMDASQAVEEDDELEISDIDLDIAEIHSVMETV